MKLRDGKRILRWFFLSILVGILAGTAAALFLISLEWVTHFREQHPEIIWSLPIAGGVIGWLFYKYGEDISSGSNLILEEIHQPQRLVPFRLTPFIFFGTIITHLFGGSAGREGAAVQMGASLADQLSRFFHIEKGERKILLISGMGAGFSAAIGAPLAGVIFGMEVLRVGRFKAFAWFESLMASYVAYYVAIFWGAHHTEFPTVHIDSYRLRSFLWILPAGVLFGLAARLFIILTHQVEKLSRRLILYPPLRPLFGGILLVVFYIIEGSYQYAGLGINVIQQAFGESMASIVPLYKMLFTALTVGSGFKGGEFVPLVFIGSTLGSWLSLFIPLALQVLTSVGFVSVFGAASNTPIACSVLCVELFGWEVTPYALMTCLVSYYCSGKHSIYKSQLAN